MEIGQPLVPNTDTIYIAAAAETVSSLDLHPHRPTAKLRQTGVTLVTFVLAMLMHPEAQKTAQKEIESVLSGGRLPDLEDRDSLPYVTALVKECIRYAAYRASW